MESDAVSEKKLRAKQGQDYYECEHDIQNYRLFYYNADGELKEDKTRNNIKIPHPFFTELCDQATQYILSNENGIIKSYIPELQNLLDEYFNTNDDFIAELSELITGSQTKGFDYMYAHKNEENKLSFECADSMGVIEVRAKDTDDGCSYVIYWYIDRIEKGKKAIKRIQVWDDAQTYFYVQDGDKGDILIDNSEPINPRPHTLYSKNDDGKMYYEGFGYIPFFRLDNNKKQISWLKAVKYLIDDYDIHASALSNNLADFDTPLYVVKGFEGDNLDELQQNIKTKKMIGTDEEGGIDVHTVEVPYEARKAKLELDEKNIYRFGMGLNTAGLKDTAATTNIAIKAAYSLLDMKCNKIKIRLKQFLKKLIKAVLEEINAENDTAYKLSDVYFDFTPQIMSNAQENAQVALTEAQEQQTRVTTILNLAAQLDDETIVKAICEVMDLDYEEIKDKLPKDDTYSLDEAQKQLNAAPTDEGGDGTNESGTEGSAAGTA